MSIHKEGFKILVILIIILLALNLLIRHFFLEDMVLRYIIISASLLLFFFVLQFFRHPNIKVPYNDNHILAPADGKVVVVEKTIEEECLKDERIQISIFMSPVNVHVNRSPAEGRVKYFKYHPGKYLVAWHPKSSTLNERTTMTLTLKNGLDIVVRQIAGIMARRIKYYVKEGDKLDQGAEFGFIRFGSRLDVFLPTDADIRIKPGMTARAGKTVLAVLGE
jgi:phosphatidylserine decarboxylase